MQHLVYNRYASLPLPILLRHLEDDYFDSIEQFVSVVITRLDELKQQEALGDHELYITLCDKIITEVLQQIRLRRQVLYPYVIELIHKVNEGHNCATCNGGCTANHKGHLLMYLESAAKVKNMLYRLSQLHVNGSSTVQGNKTKNLLVNEMILLDTKCKELFYLEETILLPKIEETQNEINAV